MSFKDDPDSYIDAAGKLKYNLLMQKYIKYIKERGGLIFQGRNYYEGVYQYNLDQFLYSYITEMGGKVYPETSASGGRVDILIILNNKEYLIEVKANISKKELAKAKNQVLKYLKRKELNEGYLVIYDDTIDDFELIEEKIDDINLSIWLIKTYFEKPSEG